MKSSDYIILLLLLVILVPAFKESFNHLLGEGSCCGGKKIKVKKKKIKGKPKLICKISISDMQCKNCANTITDHLNKVDGVCAKVDINKKLALIKIYNDTSVSYLKQLITNLGYAVTNVETL